MCDRWIRGDWQIAGWLLPRALGAAGESLPNTIGALGRWKIFDNLRRSLVPVGMLTLLLGTWASNSAGFAFVSSALVLFTVGIVSFSAALRDLCRKPRDIPLRAHLIASISASGGQAAQVLFSIVFLPFDAYMSVDAIARTAVRMLWTRRNLLEWKTSSDAQRGSRASLPPFYRSMAFAPVVSLLALGLLSALAFGTLPIALPFLEWMPFGERTTKDTKKSDQHGLRYLYIDKAKLLCPDGTLASCKVEANGEPFTYDQHHLSFGFARFVGQRIAVTYGGKLEQLKFPRISRRIQRPTVTGSN